MVFIFYINIILIVELRKVGKKKHKMHCFYSLIGWIENAQKEIKIKIQPVFLYDQCFPKLEVIILETFSH